MIVVVAPGDEHRPGLGQAGDDRLVQALVPQTGIEVALISSIEPCACAPVPVGPAFGCCIQQISRRDPGINLNASSMLLIYSSFVPILLLRSHLIKRPTHMAYAPIPLSHSAALGRGWTWAIITVPIVASALAIYLASPAAPQTLEQIGKALSFEVQDDPVTTAADAAEANDKKIMLTIVENLSRRQCAWAQRVTLALNAVW